MEGKQCKKYKKYWLFWDKPTKPTRISKGNKALGQRKISKRDGKKKHTVAYIVILVLANSLQPLKKYNCAGRAPTPSQVLTGLTLPLSRFANCSQAHIQFLTTMH